VAAAPSAACTAGGSSSVLGLSVSSSQHALQQEQQLLQPEDAVAGTAAAGGWQQALAGDDSSSCLDATGSAGSSSHRFTAATVEVDGASGPLRPEGSIVTEGATATALACAVSSASSPPAVCQGGGEQDPAGSSEDPESFIYQDEGADGTADTPRFCSSASGGSGRGSSSSPGAAGGSPPPAAVTVAAGFSVSLAGSPAAGSSAARVAAAGPDFLEGELGPWSSEDAVLSAPAGGARNSSSGGARPLSAHGPRAGRSCGRQHDSVTHHQQQQPRCQQLLAQHVPHARPSSAPAQTHLRSWLAGKGAPQQHQLDIVSESSQEGLSLLRSSNGSSSSRSRAQPQQHFATGWSGRPASTAPVMPSPVSGCSMLQRSRGQAKWDDSPLPLCIPKWVPMAEAVQAGPVAAAAATAPGGVVTTGSSGRWDALDSSVGVSTRGAASVPDSLASSRPQTAGARMQQQQQRGASRHASVWGPAAALLPSRPGSSSSKNMEPCCWYCGGRAAGSCSCRGPGPSRPATAGAGLRGLRGAGAASSAGGAGDVSAYLLDVLQQVRRANACCRQLGLLKQFRLTQASAARPSSTSSSKRPEPRQPSQVVELWKVGSSCGTSSRTAGVAGPPERGTQHSAPAGAPADATWHLRRRLTLQQFLQHLAGLRNYAATAAMSTGAARASCCCPVRPASTGRRAQSPTRPQQHSLNDRRSSSNRRSSSARAAAGRQMLLVLSPRGAGGGSSGGAGCVLRSVMSPPASHPASAPGGACSRACSRLSPRRQRGCES
jgi:hypothetical protein